MPLTDLAVYLLKFYIPALYSVLFRAFGLGYTTKRRLWIGVGAYTVYVLAVPALLITWMGYGQYTHISSVVMTLGSLAVLIFSTDPPGKTIFLQLVQGSMVTTLSVLLNMVRNVFSLSYPVLVLLLLVASSALYAFALRHWAKPLRFMADNLHDSLPALLLLPIITMVIVNLIPVYPAQNFYYHPIFCTGMMLAVELAFFLYIYTLYRNLRKISILSKQELKAELLQSEVAAYQAYVDGAKQNRHDLRHHDALILEQLEAGDVAGAKEYLRAHDQALEEGSLKQFCHNTTANAMLRLYQRRAEEQGVAFSVVADIPQELPLTSPEVGGLLGNLLENALHAAAQCPVGVRRIAFSVTTVDHSLLLEVRNTALAGVEFRNDLPVSKKPGGGTGTRSIAATVKAHGGMVEFSQRGGEFFSRVILPL